MNGEMMHFEMKEKCGMWLETNVYGEGRPHRSEGWVWILDPFPLQWLQWKGPRVSRGDTRMPESRLKAPTRPTQRDYTTAYASATGVTFQILQISSS